MKHIHRVPNKKDTSDAADVMKRLSVPVAAQPLMEDEEPEDEDPITVPPENPPNPIGAPL